jgi:Flp pilus assembly protein TadG
MISFFRKLMRDKRGNALVIAGAALPLVIGSAGLASDTIQWTLWKRQLQRGADSAALAGVYDRIYNNGDTGNITSAVNTDLGKNNHVGIALLNAPEISYPADTANYAGAVKVRLKIQKTLGFSSVFLSSAPIIIAEATAATIPTGVYCVVSLEDTSATGITATGNGDINLGCGMITNSTSLTAAIATGSSDVDATPIAAVGDIKESDNWNGAELLPFTVKEEDPFDGVNVPPFTACQGGGNKLFINSAGDTDRSALDSNKTVCFSGMDLQKGNITLGSNTTYIIDSGDFEIGAQAHVTCNHCTIVLTNSTAGTPVTIGNVKINAGAEVDMSASNSGTFDRILFYQDRRATSGPSENNLINGNSDSLMTGAFYFPTRQMEINGTAGLNFQCAQFVARTVTFSGNGSINNSCSGGYGDKTILGRHVRLVA